MGGTQSLHCNGRDEALGLPTEQSAQLALRTQQIIASEAGVINTVDPVGGSYAIEQLTNEIEHGAVNLIARIDAHGGTLRAIETGMIQREIQNTAYVTQQAVDRGQQTVVGVNHFVSNEHTSIETSKIDPNFERRQIHRVRAIRTSRNVARWQLALDQVSSAARSQTNLVEPVHCGR